MKQPSNKTLERWATDGCKVEPDSYCPHGKPSWLMYLGYI